MPRSGLIEHVTNPLIRAFFPEHRGEFVDDAGVFAEQVLAHVPSESRPFIGSTLTQTEI